jgi:hypothetical protein
MVSWQHRHGNVTISANDAVEAALSAWSDLPSREQNKLTLAADLAPRMARAAIDALKAQLELRQTFARNPNDTELGIALRKYFNLKYDAERQAEATYWKYVSGILAVYQKVHSGLTSAYAIVISDIGCRAGVNFATNGLSWQPVSPIRAAFGFVDEWGHVPWAQGAYGTPGDIEISFDYLMNNQTGASDLARTLVHEGSHKWARTKDILYKSQSLSEVLSENDAAELGQEFIPRASRPKPLAPLAGLTEGGQLIADERYLENADSYAWTARRMFKKALAQRRS